MEEETSTKKNLFGNRRRSNKRKKQQRRQRAGSAEDDEHDANALQTLHELREEQKLRHRPAGILPIKQKSGTNGSASTKAEVKIETYGLYDPKGADDSETKQRLVKLLDGQFTGESDIIQLNPHEKLMNDYVEQQLRKKLKTSDSSTESKPTVSEEDALYQVPAHLQASVSSNVAQEDSNAAVNWGAGIAEVELPDEDKKNEARTKAAIEESHCNSPSASTFDLPKNYSSSYSKSEKKQRAPPKGSRSHDDALVREFIKKDIRHHQY